MEDLVSSAGEFLAGAKVAMAYWFLAIFGSIFFAITGLMTMLGFGGLDDVELDADGAMPDHLDSGALDFKLFSIRSILAFLTVFGWGGVLWGKYGIWGFLFAFAAGFVTQVITALLFWMVMKLQCSGTVHNKDYVGSKATVYIGIPGGRKESGKIKVSFQGATRELRAVADETLETGCAVVIAEQIDDQLFLVKKIDETTQK
ncbi:MAG: hypothetical protein J6W81_04310 [Lentisphaeria bacterium]|nr:hypothetical protein [Lentisphaeria bacterium]